MSSPASTPAPPVSPHDSKPYGTTTWDVRNRVKTTTPTGSVYHNNNKKSTSNYKTYQRSVDGDIYHWIIVNGVPQNNRMYRDREITIAEAVSPQGQKTRTVTNYRGEQITSQTYDATTGKWYGSYYVYDDYGRPRFVIPPVLVSTLDNTFPNNIGSAQVNELCFQTEYDHRGRTTREKAPGAGWMEYVYDKWDRVVLSRHEAQKEGNNNYWTFYKYDARNRQVMDGELRSNASRTTLQSQASGCTLSRFEQRTNSAEGYTLHSSYPRQQDFSDYQVYNVQYYDTYGYQTNHTAPLLFTTFSTLVFQP